MCGSPRATTKPKSVPLRHLMSSWDVGTTPKFTQLLLGAITERLLAVRRALGGQYKYCPLYVNMVDLLQVRRGAPIDLTHKGFGQGVDGAGGHRRSAVAVCGTTLQPEL